MRTLRAAVQELCTILKEVPRDLDELFDLGGHVYLIEKVGGQGEWRSKWSRFDVGCLCGQFEVEHMSLVLTLTPTSDIIVTLLLSHDNVAIILVSLH